jgi:hypothetical protein
VKSSIRMSVMQCTAGNVIDRLITVATVRSKTLSLLWILRSHKMCCIWWRTFNLNIQASAHRFVCGSTVCTNRTLVKGVKGTSEINTRFWSTVWEDETVWQTRVETRILNRTQLAQDGVR